MRYQRFRFLLQDIAKTFQRGWKRLGFRSEVREKLKSGDKDTFLRYAPTWYLSKGENRDYRQRYRRCVIELDLYLNGGEIWFPESYLLLDSLGNANYESVQITHADLPEKHLLIRLPEGFQMAGVEIPSILLSWTTERQVAEHLLFLVTSGIIDSQEESVYTPGDILKEEDLDKWGESLTADVSNVIKLQQEKDRTADMIIQFDLPEGGTPASIFLGPEPFLLNSALSLDLEDFKEAVDGLVNSTVREWERAGIERTYWVLRTLGSLLVYRSAFPDKLIAGVPPFFQGNQDMPAAFRSLRQRTILPTDSMKELEHLPASERTGHWRTWTWVELRHERYERNPDGTPKRIFRRGTYVRGRMEKESTIKVVEDPGVKITKFKGPEPSSGDGV